MDDQFKIPDHPLLTKYKLYYRIATGQNGTVYAAMNNETNLVVAVKLITTVINEECFFSNLDFLRRELKALQFFSAPENRHDNIVQMLDHDVIDMTSGNAVLWMFMDWMNTDLSKYMARIREMGQVMPLQTIKGISFQVLSGLAHIHERGYVYKDMKPANILINQAEIRAKICDFGLASLVESNDIKADNLGEVSYRPVEVMLQISPFGPAGDMWGLGVIISEMALGARLFEGTSKDEVLSKILPMLGAPDMWTIPQENYIHVLGSENHRAVYAPERLSPAIGRLGQDGLELVADLLSIDWQSRPTAQQALESSFFDSVRPS